MDKSNGFYLVFFLGLYSVFFGVRAYEPLRVVTEHLPPYQIASNNRLVAGSSYLLMKEVLKQAGYPARIEVMPWARAYQTALTGRNVVIFSMTRSPEREILFHWIGKLRELDYTFYSVKSNTHLVVDSIERALHYTVVAVRGSVEAEVLLQNGFKPGENLVLISGYIQAWQFLLKGRADLIYANELIGNSIHTSLGEELTPFIKQPFSGMHAALYVAASKASDPEVITRLRQALSTIKEADTFSPLQQPSVTGR